MPLRALTDRILNRVIRGDGPPGATHVVSHVPPQLLDSSHPCFPPEGYWELWLARDFARGYCAAGNDPEGLDGPASMAADDVRFFAEEMLGRPVILSWFTVDLSGEDGTFISTEPSYWVTPAA